MKRIDSTILNNSIYSHEYSDNENTFSLSFVLSLMNKKSGDTIVLLLKDEGQKYSLTLTKDDLLAKKMQISNVEMSNLNEEFTYLLKDKIEDSFTLNHEGQKYFIHLFKGNNADCIKSFVLNDWEENKPATGAKFKV